MEKRFEFALKIKDPNEFENTDLEGLLQSVHSAVQHMDGPAGFVVLLPVDEGIIPYRGVQQVTSLLKQYDAVIITYDPSFKYLEN